MSWRAICIREPRKGRAKVLCFDGTGICLFSKRLEKGRVRGAVETQKRSTIEMTLRELALFAWWSDDGP